MRIELKKENDLLKNTTIIFIGKFFTQLLAFILLPIYTFSLQTGEYGYIDLVQTYIGLIVPILILRTDSSIFRFLIDSRDDSMNESLVFSSGIIIVTFQLFAFILVAFIMKRFIEIKYYSLIIGCILTSSIFQLLLQSARGIGDNILFSKASIFYGIINTSLNLLFLFVVKLKGNGILISICIANTMVSLFLIQKQNIKFSIVKPNFFLIKRMLHYSLPMIPDSLSWWIVNVSDRTIISFIIGNSANGIYAISSKFSNITSTFVQVFNMSWQENASISINNDDKNTYFSKVLNDSYCFFYSISLILMVTVRILFPLIISHEYVEGVEYIPILLLSNLFNAMAIVTGAVYIAEKKTSRVAISTMAGAIINILINLMLIRNIKLWAACISTLISYIVLTIFRYFDIQKYVKMKINFFLLTTTLAIYALSAFGYYKNNLYLNILNIIIAVLISTYLNKDNIIKIISKIYKSVKERKKIYDKK